MQYMPEHWRFQLVVEPPEGLLLHQLGLLHPLSERPERTVDFLIALVQLARSWQHRPLAEH